MFAVVALVATRQSPATHEVRVSGPAPTESSIPGTVVTPATIPLATEAQFPPLSKMIASLTGTVRSNADPKAVVENPTSAEIVATTDTKAYAIWGGTRDDKPIFVAQVTGEFVCQECQGIRRAGDLPRTGRVLQVGFDSTGTATDFGFGDQPADLSKLGTVYRLDLTPPLATTTEFPPLEKIINNVAGEVTANSDPNAVVKAPISAEIVATTDTRAWAIWGGTKTGKPIYVVQVTGEFVCNGCSRPATATTGIHGTALQVFFDASGGGFGMGMSPEPKDLSGLGKVYRLPLP